MNPITPFGKKWEWSRSIWLGWLLFPFGFCSFVSFFYIGARAKKMKWIISGFIYLLIVVQFFIVDEQFHEEHIVFDLSVGLVLMGWIAAFVQAFLARIEYLQMLARQIAPDKMPPLMVKPRKNQKIRTRGTISPSTKPAPSKHPIKRKKNRNKSGKQPTLVNINRATEEQLKQLPSVGSFLAKEIIIVRRKVSSFTSYTHLVHALKIKPHILIKAKQYIVFSDQELKDRREQNQDNQNKPNQQKQNKLRQQHPQTKKQSGRFVDY